MASSAVQSSATNGQVGDMPSVSPIPNASGKSGNEAMAVSARYKLVIVGDGACGKTSLLTLFKTGTFPTDYIPTIFETDVAYLTPDGSSEPIELTLWDTAGQESYDKLRPLSYPGSDVTLICFSIDRPDSLANVETTWAPEVKHYCRGVPIVLVGNKTDLREDETVKASLAKSGESVVNRESGVHVAHRIRADSYVECSAKLDENVGKVFQTAAKAAINHRNKNVIVRQIRRKCVLL